MKRRFLILSLLLTSFALFMACDDDDNNVKPEQLKGLKLMKQEVSLQIGETAKIEITEGNGAYTVKADNNKVKASVKENKTIVIEAVAVGKSVVTVTDTKSKKTATIKITITEMPELTLEKTKVSMKIGETTEVNITNGNGEYTVKADDKVKASVKENKAIVIEAVAVGESVVTVTDTKSKKTATIKVTIEDIPNITVDKQNFKLIVSQSTNVKILTGNAPFKVESLATENVSAEIQGEIIKVTALKCDAAGINSTEAKIQVTDSKQKTLEITVNVFNKVDFPGYGLNIELEAGKSENIIINSGDVESITLTSNNEEVATAEIITESNLKWIKVSAHKAGECKIEVTDGVATKTISVTVTGGTANPVEIWGPDENYNDAKLSEFTLINKEQHFTLKGGSGKYTAECKNDKITTEIIEEDDRTLLKVTKKDDITESGDVVVTVKDKNDENNTATITINVLAPITINCFKGGEELTKEDDSDDDFAIKVKVNDVITANLAGMTGKYEVRIYNNIPIEELKIDGTEEKEIPYGSGTKKIQAATSNSITITPKKAGSYEIGIKDYSLLTGTVVWFKIIVTE